MYNTEVITAKRGAKYDLLDGDKKVGTLWLEDRYAPLEGEPVGVVVAHPSMELDGRTLFSEL